MTASPGLRERKKQRTREAIAQAAHALFVAHGYAGTTLGEIAEAADVSTRTIFSYYDSKEDILFAGLVRQKEALTTALENRLPDEDTLDAVRRFVLTAAATPRSDLDVHVSELIAADRSLQDLRRARLAQVVDVMLSSIAADLKVEVGDTRTALVGACLVAGLGQLIDRGAQRGNRLTPDEVAQIMDAVLVFVRAGLAELSD